MKRILCLALCALLLAGCAPAEPPADPPAEAPGGAVTLASTKEPAALLSPMEEEIPAAGAVARGANDFAFRLSAALLAVREDAGESLVCSPYSVWLPLAALLNATEQSAQPALLEALGAAGVSVADVNRAASRMLYSLTNQHEREFLLEERREAEQRGEPEAAPDYEAHDPLSIANAIFVDRDMTLDAGFAQAFADYYRGAAMEVDFSDASAVRAVNEWASKQTEGLIPEIVQGFDPETVAAIANAIYFSDRWSWEFDEAETEEGPFHGAKGEQTAHFMLRQGDSLRYYEDARVQAMPLALRTGGGMLILLPRDGDASALLGSMTADYFDEILQNTEQATGTLKLPRFSLSAALRLNEALQALGVNLFDSELLPLSGLVEGMDACLTTAVQRAVIEVDEKGTTAAAVTVMAAAGAAMPMPTEPFSMICDRPFAFVLYGPTYDGGSQALFTGVVNGIE